MPGSVGRKDAGALLPPGVFAGEQREAGRRAGGGTRIARAEVDALLRDAVDIWRLHRGRAIAGDVAIAEVIGVDQDDVRLLRGNQREGKKGEEPDGLHGARIRKVHRKPS
jgi:hypothetical protein